MKNSRTNNGDSQSEQTFLKTDIMAAARRECKVPENFCNCNVRLPVIPARNQKETGRCWIEAGLGDIEYRVFQTTGKFLPPLSSEYLAYHDLKRKVHLFLKQIENTKHLPIDDALCMHLLKKPIQDAGQWSVFHELLAQVGAMPSQYMKPSIHHENTHTLLAGLCQKLRYCACKIRDDSVPVSVMEDEADSIIDRCLGAPPTQFIFDDKLITPKEFYQKYIECHLSMDYLSFICVPAAERPFFTTYMVKWLYSETETGSPVKHFNIPPELFCTMVRAQLTEGMPVWIGADAGQFSDKNRGIFDTKMYAFEEMLNTTLRLSKGKAMLYQDSMMSHAMLLWGVSDSGWCVRNSFGTEVGQNGYAWMSDEWFDRYVYQAIIRKSIVSGFMDLNEISRAPVKLLEPWDAIGCLA